MNFILKHKGFAFVILLFVFFHGFWISLYKDLIVNKFLIYSSRSVWVDIAELLLVIVSVWWTVTKIRNRFFLKSESLLIPGGILIGYLLVRWTNGEELMSNWTFRDFEWLKEIRYFDVIFVLCSIPFFLKYFGIKKNAHQKGSDDLAIFTSDDPIDSAENDVLDLEPRCFQVYSMLKSCRNDKSVAIGIVGGWGQGKSSFMNLIEERFRNETDYIVVHFNSWLNVSTRSIIHDFFNTIEEKLTPFGLDISNEIKKYGDKVLSVYKSSATESILNGLSLLNDSSLSKDYRELNKKLNVLDKRLLVFFDDLDRLQPEEVFEALKLIRNTASFDVCNYVVGYDRSYINAALDRCGIPNADKYCEKIFLKEFPLLPVTDLQIRNFLALALMNSIPNSVGSIESFFLTVEKDVKRKQGNPFSSLRNLRDAKRFVNEIVVSIRRIEKEVEISEFILVKLLKFSYYDVYRLLYNKDKYVDASNIEYKVRRDDRPGKLKLRPIKGNTMLSSTFKGSLLESDVKDMGIYDNSIADIDTIVTKIFNIGFLKDNFGMVSLCYGMNYYKYFIDEIDQSLFSKNEFDQFIQADAPTMMKIVDNAFNLGKLEGLVHYIYRYKYANELTSQQHYKNFVHILFYIAKLALEPSKSDYFGINKEFFYEVLTNEYCIKVFFSGKNEYDAYIWDKFWNNLHPPIKLSEFEPDFLRHHFEKRTHPDLPFSRDEYEEYLEQFMTLKMDQVKTIDSEFWYCYGLCSTKVSTPHGRGRSGRITKFLIKNKDKFLFELLPKFLDEFLVDSIEVSFDEVSGTKKYRFHRGTEVAYLFGTDEAFRNYLNSFGNDDKFSKFSSEFREEFMGFYVQFSSGNETEYYFQYPPMRDKFENTDVL